MGYISSHSHGIKNLKFQLERPLFFFKGGVSWCLALKASRDPLSATNELSSSNLEMVNYICIEHKVGDATFIDRTE